MDKLLGYIFSPIAVLVHMWPEVVLKQRSIV